MSGGLAGEWDSRSCQVLNWQAAGKGGEEGGRRVWPKQSDLPMRGGRGVFATLIRLDGLLIPAEISFTHLMWVGQTLDTQPSMPLCLGASGAFQSWAKSRPIGHRSNADCAHVLNTVLA